MLGLPDGIKACLFDLDGVLTQTAKVHAKAWKEMFDGFLETQDGQKPFDAHADYDEYVDGKPREDGVRDFLKSRGIEADEKLVDELATKKNDIVQHVIERDGVEPYEGSVRYLEAARDAGLRRAVVSSSHNCEAVLKAAGIDHLLEERVDGDTAVEQHLEGKPAPDMFLAGAQGASASRRPRPRSSRTRSSASRPGAPASFGHVVGVDRVGQRDALREHGADVVVDDLDELLG